MLTKTSYRNYRWEVKEQHRTRRTSSTIPSQVSFLRQKMELWRIISWLKQLATVPLQPLPNLKKKLVNPRTAVALETMMATGARLADAARLQGRDVTMRTEKSHVLMYCTLRT